MALATPDNSGPRTVTVMCEGKPLIITVEPMNEVYAHSLIALRYSVIDRRIRKQLDGVPMCFDDLDALYGDDILANTKEFYNIEPGTKKQRTEGEHKILEMFWESFTKTLEPY